MFFQACKLDCGLARGPWVPVAAMNRTLSAVLVPDAARWEPRSGSAGLFNTRDSLEKEEQYILGGGWQDWLREASDQSMLR